MPVIPSGNISLLELLEFAFEQKYGNATVDPLEDHALVDSQWKSIHDAIKAHDIILYVESLDGTEKRLTDQHSDESLMWRTLLTGKLEHEPDPAVYQRTVYVRDDDASTFLKEFTQPDPMKTRGRDAAPSDRTVESDEAPELQDTTTSGVNSKVGGKAKGGFSKAKVRRWYTKRVKTWPPDQRPPSREDDIRAAKDEFDGVTDRAIRKLREEIAPAAWKEQGRPKAK